mmetsp:Transcript_53202/g.149926  ORF Transcript_53202/g.149926 Transcript_53202/m.149926 type:complete len:158 (+) Transcript_53202:48-521(+)
MARTLRGVALALALLLPGEASAEHGVPRAAPDGTDTGAEVLPAPALRGRGHALGCGPRDAPPASSVLSSDVFQALDFVKGVVNGDWGNFLQHLLALLRGFWSLALWGAWRLVQCLHCICRARCLHRLRWPARPAHILPTVAPGAAPELRRRTATMKR